MPALTRQHLIDAGWSPGPRLSELLATAAEYESRGVSDPAYLLKLLERDFGREKPKLRCRDEPLPFAEAIEATGPEDEANLGKVRRLMGELMRVPVIEAGTVMPDACPAGSAEATIPVGGAVAARQAILPAAHSSDICCSMHASVFRSGESTARLLDALVASTRFGPGGRPGEDRVDHPVLHETVWSNPFLSGLEERAAAHLADQGDGNHFAFLHGKGATPAWRDEESRPLLGLIPLNMAEPILLTLGGEGSDYLGSAPHGAGRNRSRTATLREFRRANEASDERAVAKSIAAATRGLDIRWYCGRPDLTESPLGYKLAAQVREQIERFALAETVALIEPLGCIMAGDAGSKSWRRSDHLTPKQKRQMAHRAERRKDRQGLRRGLSGSLEDELEDEEG